MPYRSGHKQETRGRIVEAARKLFNRRGFNDVSIDDIMAAAGLTRGGFYNHFKTKDVLYAEVLNAYGCDKLPDNLKISGVNCNDGGAAMARQMVDGYVSRRHLEQIEDQCPLIALPSDVARAGPEARSLSPLV